MPVSEFTKRVLARVDILGRVTPREETPRTDFVNQVLLNAGVRTPEEQQRRIAETARVAEEARIEAERKGGFLGVVKGTVKEVGGILKDIGQSIARNIASAGVTLLSGRIRAEKGKIEFRREEITVSAEDFPKLLEPIAKSIFTEEPIKSIEQRVAEAELKVKDFGTKLKETRPALGARIESNASLLAFAGVMGSVGIDLTPFGGSSKNVFKALVKVKSVDEAVKLLLKLGVADDLAKTFADDVVKVGKTADAKKLFESIAETQRTTRVAKPVTEVVPRVVPEVPKVAPIGVTKGRAVESITDLARGKKGIDPFVRVERGFIASAKEAVPELKIAGQYIPRSTDNLAIRAKNLIKDDIGAAEKLALTGTDDKAVATASELIKHYDDLATKATAQAEKNAFYDQAAEVAVNIAPKLTEQGRAIQAASILGRQTPEGHLRFAARTIQKFNEEVELARGGILGLRKKVPELTGEQAADFLKQSKKIQKMEDGIDKAIAFKKLQDDIADLIPSPWYKKIINLWKAGLLTGIKTSGLNTFSNLFHGLSEIIKDIPAIAVDKVVKIFTGERTIALNVLGFKGGVKEGFDKGLLYMRTGFDERNVAIKLDWRRVSFGKSKLAKALQTYEETVFHWMGAMDQPFYYGAKARSLGSQAIAKGKNKGLKGAELKKFVQNLIENPTDDMLKAAVNDAEISVFQNRTVLGGAARAIQKVPGGEIVVPFGRTPSAVAMQIINYSPVGVVTTIVRNIGKGRFDQRLFAQGIGRAMTGTAVMFIGMTMFTKDLISLDFPKTERERNQWKLEGRKPNAIKTPDGKWRSVLTLGPAGMLLILGGQLQQSLNKNGSLSTSLLEAAPATLKSFTEQTFLVGINQFARAINDPGRYAENVAARTTGSLVPTIVSDVSRAIDPLERRTFARAEGFLAPFFGRIPGVRQALLEPQIDVFGQPLARAGNAMETMVDPTRPTRIKSGDLVIELRRLFDLGFSSTPTRFADEKSYSESLTPEQITYLQEKAGLILEEKLKNLIAHPEYKKLDDDGKMRKIKNFTNKARVVARAEMIEELTRELLENDLKTKLSEFKASGFMTQQVFKEWQKLFPR